MIAFFHPAAVSVRTPAQIILRVHVKVAAWLISTNALKKDLTDGRRSGKFGERIRRGRLQVVRLRRWRLDLPLLIPRKLTANVLKIVHANSDHVRTTSLSAVSPNETGAPLWGSSGQRRSSRSAVGRNLFTLYVYALLPLRPGPKLHSLKAAWYKCVGSAER